MAGLRFQDPVPQFTDENGKPLSNGQAYFYRPGTSTLKAIYTDVLLTTEAANPLTLDADGRLPYPVFLQTDENYRVVGIDSLGVTQYDADEVPTTNVADAETAASEAATSAGVAVASATEATGSASASATSASAAGTSATEAATSASQAAANKSSAETAQANAEAARDAAQLSKGVYPSTAAALGDGVAGATSLVGGSGGTDGSYALVTTGGTQVTPVRGYFTVASGAVTEIVVLYPGYYTADPTGFDFSASSGLTGASATPVMTPNAGVGEYFSVPVGTTGELIQLYRVDAGPVAVAVGDPYPTVAAFADLVDTNEDAEIHALADAQSIANGNAETEQLSAIKTVGGFFKFSNGKYLHEGLTKEDVNDYTQLGVSRATTAYALNNAGVYQNFAINTLRVTDRGALLEDAATQIFTQPVTLTDATWAVADASLTTQAGEAPDGSGNAYDLIESTTGTTGPRLVEEQAVTAAEHTFSAHIERGDNRYFMLSASQGASAWAAVIDFDAAGGPVIAQAAGALGVDNLGIERLGTSDVYRAFIAIDFPSASNVFFFARGAGGPTFADRNYSTTSGNNAGRLSWFQLELGLTPSSPILVGGNTRSADSVTLNWTASSDLSDTVAISYEGGISTFTRDDLAASTTINLVTDGDGAWLTKYITSIILTPALADAFRTQDQRNDDHAAGVFASLASLENRIARTLAANGLGRIQTVVPSDLDRATATDSGLAPYMLKSGNVYYWNGQFFGTEAAAIAAAGGTLDGQTILLDALSEGPNLIAALDWGDFGLQDGPATVTLVGDEYEVDTTGVTPAGLFLSYQGSSAKALKFSTLARRGTVASGVVTVGLSNFNSALSAPAGSASIISTEQVQIDVIGDGKNGSPYYFGIYQVGGTAGTLFLKSPELREVRPAENYPQGAWTWFFEGVAPDPLPGTTQVIASSDTNGSRDFNRLELRSSGDVYFRQQRNVGTGSEVDNELLIGSLTAGQSYRIAVTTSRTTMKGSVNGSGAEQDITGTIGVSHFRLGESLSGETFGGTIAGYGIWSGVESLDWCERITEAEAVTPAVYQRKANTLLVNGDSYSVSGSTGLGLMLDDLGYDTVNIGVGGSTFEEQRDDLLAFASDPKDFTYVHWDGSPNGHTSGQFAIDLGYWQDIISDLGHDRWLYVRSGRIAGSGFGSTDFDDMADLYNRIGQLYGADRVYDPFNLIATFAISDPDDAGFANDQTDVANGVYPRSTLYDGVHLNETVRRAIALDIAGRIESLSAQYS